MVIMKIRFNSGLKWNFLSRIRFVSTGTGISKRHSVSGLADEIEKSKIALVYQEGPLRLGKVTQWQKCVP